MLARGEYLTKVIDCKATASKDDLEFMKSDPVGTKKVVPWSPSAGKTTAIRQFIVANPNMYGIMATKRKDDVYDLYYDIISQLMYLGKSDDIYSVISVFTSDTPLDSSLVDSNWIICTHERLMIEPPSLLFLKNTDYAYGSPSLLRDILIIDEYPSTLYKSWSVSQNLLGLLALHSRLANESNKEIVIYNMIKQYLDGNSDIYSRALIDSLPNIVGNNQLSKIRDNPNYDEVEAKHQINRMTYITSHLIRELDKESKKDTDKQSDRLYYSISNLLVDKSYIFDGTGDILFSGSTEYDIQDNTYPRILKLVRPTQIIKDFSKRSQSADELINNYSSILNQIAKENSSKILVYLWKWIDDHDNYLDTLKSRLDDPSRYYFVHYQSGQERVTSRYADATTVVVLGKFLLPQKVITDINRCIGTNISSYRYTASLIIQFIYRSAARLGNPISLYISSSYPKNLVELILDKCNANYTDILDSNIESAVDYSLKYTELVESGLCDMILDDRVGISSSNIRRYLGVNDKYDNIRIAAKLDSLGMKFNFVPNQGRGNPSIYFIFNPRS